MLLLVIGPRWEKIWNERISNDINYVALDLQRAHALDVPIIPVTLDGTQLSEGLNLGSINFIYNYQFYDMSDKQGCWRGDVDRLVGLLESVPGLGAASVVAVTTKPPTNISFRAVINGLAAMVVQSVVLAVWFGLAGRLDWLDLNLEASRTDGQADIENTSSTIATDTPKALSQQTSDAVNVAQHAAVSVLREALPNVNGTWQDRHGTVLILQKSNDGTFVVESPGNGSGQGRFLENMPGKFEIEMSGIDTPEKL